jgi:hypothetical protein
MGTPASLLELIATGGSRRQALNAELTQRAAQAKQAEAAARHADAETEKATIEADAMRQAQADQQVISDAFAHVGGNPKLMDKYIKANASGAGVQRWQMDNMKLREQMSKTSAADLDRAEKVHKVMGSSLGYLNDVPDDQLQAEYAKVSPAVQQLDPTIQLPPQIDRMGLKRLMGQLTYADEVLKQQKEAAALEQTKQQTANSRQEGELKERSAFLQGVRPDMPYAEYKALPGYDKFAKVYPSPAAAAAAAKVEGIAVKDRTKAEQDARVLAGMSPTGITAEQQARIDQDKEEAKQRERQHRESLGVQIRGQNMTNERMREANDNRPPSAEESKAYGYFKRMDDAARALATMDSAIAQKSTIGQAWQNNAPNFLQSEEGQVFNQAKKQFTEAYLRRDSGAAISNGEYAQVDREYFPQPGDGPQVLARKQQGRKVAIEAIEKEAGRAIRKFDAPGAAPASGGGSYEHFAVDGKGHQIGSRGNKWFDVKTGKEIQ